MTENLEKYPGNIRPSMGGEIKDLQLSIRKLWQRLNDRSAEKEHTTEFTLYGPLYVSTSGRWSPPESRVAGYMYARLSIAGTTDTILQVKLDDVLTNTLTIPAGESYAYLGMGIEIQPTSWITVGISAAGTGATTLVSVVVWQ